MGRPAKSKSDIAMTAAERKRRQRSTKKGRQSENAKARRRYRGKQREIQNAPTKARREASRNAPPLPDGAEFRIGDCREVLADIADNSAALVLTDPPYGNEAEPLYVWLAEFAARVLIPGGSLLCYTGQGKLDRDIALLGGAGLTYWWLCHMPHTQPQKLFGAGVFATFKPVLWFVKGKRRTLPSGRRPLMTDAFISPKRDKLMHAWGQGEGGVWVPIENLTDPGELIVEPFCGRGEWLRIAAQRGRRAIGCDITERGTETIVTARRA
jgi:hypothetical protein